MSDIRKFTRGKDEVDLDAWLNSVSSGYDNFEKSLIGRTYTNSKGKKVKITEKDISGIRKSYNNLFKRFNSGDGQITYNYDTAERGFTDATGELNSSNVYDGIVAKHFGNTLRAMDVYKEPEATPLVPPVDYSDNALGTIFRNRLLGKNGTIRSFVDKDMPVDGVRTNKERSKLSADTITAMISDLTNKSGEFSKWTNELKDSGLKSLNSLFTVFDGDKQITDNEYLDIEKLLGLTDAREMYSTSLENNDEQDSDLPVNPSKVTFDDFINYLELTYPTYSGPLSNDISLKYRDKLGAYTLSRFQSHLLNADANELSQLLLRMFNSADDYNINNDPFIKRYYRTNPNTFSALFVATQILNTLKNKPGTLFELSDKPGTYYINGFNNLSRRTALVWDSNNNLIKEMSIHDIPYLRLQIFNEWARKNGIDQSTTAPVSPLAKTYESFKFQNGGSIKKLAKGGVTDYNSVAKYDLSRNDRHMYDIPNKKWIVRNLRSINTIGPKDDLQYNSEGDVTKMEQNDPHFILFFKDLLNNNEELAKHWAIQYIDNHDDKNIAKYWLNKWFTNGDRNKFNYKAFQTEKGLNGKYVWGDQLGGVGHDIIAKSVWIDPEGLYHSDILNGYDPDGDWEFQADKFLWVRKMKKALSDKKSDDVKKDDTNKGGDIKGNGSEIVEVDTDKPSSDKNPKRFPNLSPDLLSAARLFASLNTNNRIAKTIKPSLSPVLRDTYEKYYPVTGAFSEMLLRNRQGAAKLLEANRPFTSDASLASARMLLGQALAEDLQARGFIADDREIKRTQAEALARVEDNMARRSEVAKENRLAINKSNREKAQLEATKIAKNYQSWNNFLGGIETRLRTLQEENKQEAEAYQKLQDELANSSIYEDELKQIQTLINKYVTANPTASISSASWYIPVTLRRQEIAKRISNDNVISAGKRRGFSYSDLYKDNPYQPIDWSTIIV